MIQQETVSIVSEIDPPFTILAPEAQTSPFVLCSPHSGRAYTREFLAQSRLDPHGAEKVRGLFRRRAVLGRGRARGAADRSALSARLPRCQPRALRARPRTLRRAAAGFRQCAVGARGRRIRDDCAHRGRRRGDLSQPAVDQGGARACGSALPAVSCGAGTAPRRNAPAVRLCHPDRLPFHAVGAHGAGWAARVRISSLATASARPATAA